MSSCCTELIPHSLSCPVPQGLLVVQVLQLLAASSSSNRVRTDHPTLQRCIVGRCHQGFRQGQRTAVRAALEEITGSKLTVEQYSCTNCMMAASEQCQYRPSIAGCWAALSIVQAGIRSIAAALVTNLWQTNEQLSHQLPSDVNSATELSTLPLNLGLLDLLLSEAPHSCGIPIQWGLQNLPRRSPFYYHSK